MLNWIQMKISKKRWVISVIMPLLLLVILSLFHSHISVHEKEHTICNICMHHTQLIAADISPFSEPISLHKASIIVIVKQNRTQLSLLTKRIRPPPLQYS